MMSCQDMYKVFSQLAKALNIPHFSFGGINIIFAGDFAQLPPVGGALLFSQTIGTQVHAGLKFVLKILEMFLLFVEDTLKKMK